MSYLSRDGNLSRPNETVRPKPVLLFVFWVYVCKHTHIRTLMWMCLDLSTSSEIKSTTCDWNVLDYVHTDDDTTTGTSNFERGNRHDCGRTRGSNIEGSRTYESLIRSFVLGDGRPNQDSLNVTIDIR